MNDRLDRAERLIEQLAEQSVQSNQRIDRLGEKIDALTDIIGRWYERHGNGSAGQHPS